MFTFHVDTNAIKALELFAGDKDVRYYLNGICAKAIDPRTVRLIATDGSTLAEHRIKTETDMDGPFPREGIIPRDAFKAMKGSVAVTVTSIGTYVINDGERGGKLIDAKFPDVDRVWPRSVNLEATHINNEYIGRLAKAAKLLDMRYGGVVFQNGADSPSVFKIRDDFAGILMPMRRNDEELPSWVKTTIAPDVKKESAADLFNALLDLNACIAAGVRPAPEDAVLDNARVALLRAGASLQEMQGDKAAA
jgi:hypothetical protein